MYLQIKITKAKKCLDNLSSLLDVTAKKHKFHRFSDAYIEAEFEVFSKTNNAEIFEAYLPDGRLDSAAIIMFYGNLAAYRHK